MVVDVGWFSLFRAFLMLHPLIFGLHPPILLVLFLGLSCGLGWVGFWACTTDILTTGVALSFTEVGGGGGGWVLSLIVILSATSLNFSMASLTIEIFVLTVLLSMLDWGRLGFTVILYFGLQVGFGCPTFSELLLWLRISVFSGLPSATTVSTLALACLPTIPLLGQASCPLAITGSAWEPGTCC